MDDIDPIVKKIQKINLATYSVFKTLCEENHLHFFAISGTALGVELWNGFIPWDDDMDIAMPIQDFEKFRKTIAKKLPEPYAFIELPELGGKFFNKNTTLIEAPYAFSPDHYYGVFLDIVPLIGLPDEANERAGFSSEIKRYIVEASANSRAPELSPFTGQTTQKIKKWRQEIITKYPFGTTQYCTDLSCIKCPAYLTRGFMDPKEAKFENTTIPISSAQSQDLATAYGKIVKHVPRAERQLVHHNFYALCDLDKPCKEYSDSFSKQKTDKWLKDLSYKNHLFGISSAREAGLYKNYCLELETKIKQYQNDVAALRGSSSYKLGNRILKPFSKAKDLVKNLTSRSK
ncbi:LicD family protein [Candidatus Saccharibacteria bacterium]|nr:LicD family protein [Candidatus Saccharibacteria bacterium]